MMRISRRHTAAVIGAFVVPGLIGVAGLARVRAQEAPTTPLAFEVASVKQNKSDSPRAQLNTPPGRFVATNLPLRTLITFAYQIDGFQLEGGPSWMNSDRFDVAAKTNADAVSLLQAGGPASPVQLMMQTLLSERFKLVVHRETKEMPIFALVMARPDGTLGPNIHKSTTDCSAMLEKLKNGQTPGLPRLGPDGHPLCGQRGGPASLQVGGFPIGPFVRFLSAMLQRPVIDRTGLGDTYDFELTWTPDQLPQNRGTAPSPVSFPAIDPNGPPLPVALQEQLGMKLDATRGPVEMVVIDHVERPVEE